MLATEVAILKRFESKGVKADATAGLSLGEYGALAARMDGFEGFVLYHQESAASLCRKAYPRRRRHDGSVRAGE